MAKAPAPSAAQMRAEQLQRNMRARQFVLENSVDMWQPLPPQSVAGNPRGTVLNFQAKNVGLIKRFIVEVSFTLVRAAAETLNRTAFGPSNIFSNIILTDLNNVQRINTTGWHMYALSTARRQRAFASAFNNDSPVSQGSNAAVAVSPTPLTTIDTVRFFYEIPVSYSDTDLRGGIYAATTGANVTLQLTVNPTYVVGSAGNPTLAGYISSTAGDLGTMASFTVTVYQNYLDQIPMDPQTNQPILPLIDMSYAYMMINTVMTGLAVNQENSIAYSNYRSFLSTMCIYDNFGTATAEQADVNYWALQVANSTNIIRWDPYMTLLQTRNIIGDDFPSENGRALYYFDHRVKPINTDQYGNTLLVLNPAQVQASTSQVLIGYEMMALQQNILNASSPARY